MRGIVPTRSLTPARFPYPALRTGVGQLFDSLFDGAWETNGDSQAFYPSIDVREDDENLVVKADIPGIDPDSIDVSISEGVLTIQGERSSEEEKQEGQTHLIERRFGSFRRSFTLPSQVDVEKIDATHENGVLTIKLPKDVGAKTKKISVRAGK